MIRLNMEHVAYVLVGTRSSFVFSHVYIFD